MITNTISLNTRVQINHTFGTADACIESFSLSLTGKAKRDAIASYSTKHTALSYRDPVENSQVQLGPDWLLVDERYAIGCR